MESTATFLQVDLQNLFLTVSHGQKLDFEKIWEHFNSRETEFLTGAVVYTVRSPDFDSSRFETKLKSVGFELSLKNIQKSNRKPKPTAISMNHEVCITVDCLAKIDRFDKLILMTNSGNFSDLCKYLRTIGKKVEIWSFKESYDSVLELNADKMNFLDDQFCLKRSNISVFGMNTFDGILDSTTYRGVFQ